MPNLISITEDETAEQDNMGTDQGQAEDQIQAFKAFEKLKKLQSINQFNHIIHQYYVTGQTEKCLVHCLLET